MGIFKKAAQPEPKAEPSIEYSLKTESVTTNLTDKMLRVELEGEEAYIRELEIKENGENIRIVSGGIIIAEIGKRGKARAEIEPHIGRSARSATIKVRTGDYGEYYRLRLIFETNVTTVTVE